MLLEEKRHGEPQLGVASFTAFVATKNPTEVYYWESRETCACAQYAHSIGKFEDWVQPRTEEDYQMWERLNKLARGSMTFGQLAEKLK
jgi:hypothetical protein